MMYIIIRLYGYVVTRQFMTYNLHLWIIPQMTAMSKISTGEMPQKAISIAVTIGTQQLAKVIFAFFAKVKTGIAISATTAGRKPRKMAATI